MPFLWILFIAWILELDGVVTQALTEAPALTLKECIQDKLRNINCKEFSEDWTENISLWPPGPYAIPMTRYGCPESSMHGWREGYIRLAWQEPQTVRINSNSSSIDIVDVDMSGDAQTEKLFTDFEKYQLFLPTTPNSVALHFCYKLRNNKSVDIGFWPDGNYNVFGTEQQCPPGFESHISNIRLPDISWWDSDGYVPYFKIVNNTSEDMLQLRLCSRSERHNFSDVSGSRHRNWTHFFLIKTENTTCPTLINAYITEETLYIGLHRNGSVSMVHVATLCFYELETGVLLYAINNENNWLYETRRKNETVVKTVWHWKIFDLGKTIPVSSVDISMRFRRRLQESCISRDVSCLISRGKLDFLHSKALSCLFVPYCLVKGYSISLAFKRITEGRYLTLMYKEESNTDEVSSEQVVIHKVNVFTDTIKYGMSNSCNADIGMSNLDIGDDQISASSWQQEFTPAQSRPYLSGWCPQLSDQKPYLKVSFPTTRIVEGLSVYIGSDILLSNGLKTVVSFGGPRITLVYGDNDNGTASSKILRTDASKLDAGHFGF